MSMTISYITSLMKYKNDEYNEHSNDIWNIGQINNDHNTDMKSVLMPGGHGVQRILSLKKSAKHASKLKLI